MVRFLIVDDHEMTRLGVRGILGSKQEWQVCGEATNGWEVVSSVQALAPDVVILDVFMPGKNGFQVAAEIKRIAPQTKIIFLSMHEIPAAGRAAGGDGFVSKTAAAQELVTTIERALTAPRKMAAGA